MQIIILNGPPGVGKDTIADMFITQHQHYLKLAHKQFLYKETADYINWCLRKQLISNRNPYTAEMLEELNNDRSKKDTLLIAPGCVNEVGLTVREWLIRTSEGIVKPVHGPGHFGKLLAEYARGLYAPVIVSDGGFDEEFKEVVEAYPPGHVLLIRLFRKGCNFNNDSRRYITQSLSARVKDIHLQEGKLNLGLVQVTDAIKQHAKEIQNGLAK